MNSLTDSPYTVTEETFDTYFSYRRNSDLTLAWTCLFANPSWLKVWWDHFGSGNKPCLLAVWNKDKLMGLAPLMVENNEAHFMGNSDVCDYLDFIVSDGGNPGLFDALIDFLQKSGIVRLNLGPIREDSIAYTHFKETARQRNYNVHCQPEDVSYEMDLPGSWDEYLKLLTGKQRHEIRRKFRRLYESSSVDFHLVEDRMAEKDAMNIFLTLFKKNRSDKAAFMTDRMITYFQSLADAMEEAHMLRLFVLKLGDIYAAAVFGIDDGSTLYLYNNSYDDQFNSLSVGVLSKALTIEYAIQNGRKRYDFLKGAESYKHHMGGKPIALYRCQIDLDRDRT